jgi:hypothetical protein
VSGIANFSLDKNVNNLLNTPYYKILQKYSAPPYVLQNYGVTHAERSLSGVFLTIDLCPSKKVFEKKLFDYLAKLSAEQHRPIPVAIAVSGLWIVQHQAEFNELLKMQKEHELDITWVNHTFSHPYYPGIEIKNNFFLNPNAPDFVSDVLATEKSLLEYQQIPSVFLRFPGLVSNAGLIKKLNNLGLIALGADAWLAKGQKIHNGSFILVHGNGNEPQGIKLLLENALTHKLNFLPLNKSFFIY